MNDLVRNAKASIDSEDGPVTATRERWQAIHHFFSTSIKEGIEQRVPSAAAATVERLKEFGLLVTTNATPSTLTVVKSSGHITPRGRWGVREHQQVRELLQAAVDFLVSLGAKVPESNSRVSTVNGEHTLASVTVMLDLMVHILVKVLKKKIENCSFVDIGSGGGRVLLHALAQYPFAKAHGFEYVQNRVAVSRLLLHACHEMDQTRSALYLPKEKFGVRCLDVSSVIDWPYDVVYMFDAVYGDAVLDRLACAFNRSQIQLFLTFHTHAAWENRGLVHFVHVGTVHCENMYGSACHDDTANTERLTRKDLHKTAYILMRSPNARRPPDVWCAAPIEGRCKIVNTIYGLKDDEVQIRTVDSMGISLVTKRYNLHFPGCARQHGPRDDMCPFFNDPEFTYEREDQREARHNQEWDERASATVEVAAAAAAADEAPAAQAAEQAAAEQAAAEQAAAEQAAAEQAAADQAAAEQAAAEQAAAQKAAAQKAAAQAAEAAAAQTAAEAATAQTVTDRAAAEQVAAAATQAMVLYEPDEAVTAAAAAAAAAAAHAELARTNRAARHHIRRFGRGEEDADSVETEETPHTSFFVAKSFVNRDEGTLYRPISFIATSNNAHVFVRNSILTGVGPKLQDGDDIYSLPVALRRADELMGRESGYRDMMAGLSLFVCGESLRLAEVALAPYFRAHNAHGHGLLEWLEQLWLIRKDLQAAAREPMATRRGRPLKADPGARAAWIVAARHLLEGTDSAGNDAIDLADNNAVLGWMVQHAPTIPINTSTSCILKLATLIRRVPMITAFKVAPSWLSVHAPSIVAYFEYRANNVESCEDLDAHFSATELQGLVMFHDVLTQQVEMIPRFVAETHGNLYMGLLPSTLEIAREVIEMLAPSAAHTTETVRAILDKLAALNEKFQSYERHVVQIKTTAASEAQLRNLRPQQPFHILPRILRAERFAQMHAADLTGTSECAPAHSACLRSMLNPIYDAIADLKLISPCGVPFFVDDGDGISIYCALGRRHYIRIAYIDSAEFNMAWDGQLPKLLLRAWREMGYLVAIVKYLYSQTSLWGNARPQEVRTRYFAVVRMVRPAFKNSDGSIQPEHSFLAHEMLVKLGATRPYLNFLFVPDLAKLRALYQLVSGAKIESKKRAASIAADGNFLTLKNAHATKYRELVLQANADNVERTDAALVELSVKSYAWWQMMKTVRCGGGVRDEHTLLLHLGKLSLFGTTPEWFGVACPIWLIDTYKEAVLSSIPQIKNPVQLVLPRECFASVSTFPAPSCLQYEFNDGVLTQRLDDLKAKAKWNERRRGERPSLWQRFEFKNKCGRRSRSAEWLAQKPLHRQPRPSHLF
ncbi:hypothetical protein CYMTET_39619 [Cymbomonas tetramitiformis]|uniref:DOT1 domain-containing protein n=1 Tax=Cymbomonas tetramitiformis TaxID=36881 RepID=A0AAE0F420_9CHLO|nr:hypothetical protein CYMTET_39619 [Cymbomonas tetramitiformis]